MIKRIFNDTERRAMSCKPANLEDIGKVEIDALRIADLLKASPEVWIEVDRMRDLNEAIKFADGAVEFVVFDCRNDDMWLINTEGADYARYAARVN